ncbi:MAG: hypothetical protein Q4G30_00080 [Actinomycetaceae bacterium]|nr:hypothetical protein [Actinomycetaceae bacterium]
MSYPGPYTQSDTEKRNLLVIVVVILAVAVVFSAIVFVAVLVAQREGGSGMASDSTSNSTQPQEVTASADHVPTKQQSSEERASATTPADKVLETIDKGQEVDAAPFVFPPGHTLEGLRFMVGDNVMCSVIDYPLWSDSSSHASCQRLLNLTEDGRPDRTSGYVERPGEKYRVEELDDPADRFNCVGGGVDIPQDVTIGNKKGQFMFGRCVSSISQMDWCRIASEEEKDQVSCPTVKKLEPGQSVKYKNYAFHFDGQEVTGFNLTTKQGFRVKDRNYEWIE